MGKYAVCILCHNLHFLKVMFDNMPEQSEDITFVIANDSRVKPLVKQIWDLMKGYNLPNKVYFLNDEKVNAFVKKDLKLSDSAKEFVDINTMCLNQNLPYYFMQKGANEFDKLLMLDDDMLITGDLMQIFELKKPAYLKTCFSTTGKGMENVDLMQEFLEIAKVSYSKWITHNIISCIRLYFLDNVEHKKSYKDCMKKYFESKCLKGYFEYWKETGKGKTKAFFQDQFLENCFAWRINCQNDDMKKYARCFYTLKGLPKNKEKCVDKILTHNGCGQGKMEFLKILGEEGLISV